MSMITIGMMKNSVQKSRYEAPEAELLELVTENFLQNDSNPTPSNNPPGAGEYDDGGY